MLGEKRGDFKKQIFHFLDISQYLSAAFSQKSVAPCADWQGTTSGNILIAALQVR